MNSRKHVLAVGGTPQTGAAIQAYFSAEGFRAGLAANGHALLGIMARDPADLVITELALPGEDSFSIIRLLRERHGCGVIVLTAKSDLTDRVAALEAGADDYMLKPHEPRELLARARSVMRRANETGKTGATADSLREIVRFDRWQFDLAGRHLLGANGESVDLTSGEYNLLGEFVVKPGHVLSREHLLQVVHNRNWEYFDRSIDVLVTRLRHKLESDPSRPAIIKTVRGAGYIFTAPVKRCTA